MKKLLTALVFLAAFIRADAQGYTPNLNLQLPPYGYPNWNTAVNTNFSKIDSAYGVLEFLYQGNYSGSTSYSASQIVLNTADGKTYISLTNANSGNSPASSPSNWAAISGSGSGGGSFNLNQYETGLLVSPSGTVLGHTNLYVGNGVTTQAVLNALVSALSSSTLILPTGHPHTPFSNPNNAHIEDQAVDVPTFVRDVKEWGAQCDTVVSYGQLNLGSTTLTINSVYGYQFTSTDAGDSAGAGAKQIEMVGLVGGVPTRFDANIVAVTNGTTATLSTAAPFTSVANASVTVGHPDDAAIASAFTYVAGTSQPIEFPQGTCWSHSVRLYGQSFHGLDPNRSAILGHAGEDVIAGDDQSKSPYTGQGGGQQIYSMAWEFDPRIDAAKPWNEVTPNGSLINHAALYRPTGVLTQWSNNPTAQGWFLGSGINGTGTLLGTASVAGGSASVTVTTASGTYPANGNVVVFPYTSAGVFTATVTSGGGTASLVLSATYPGASSSQQEFVAGTSAQTTAVAIPSVAGRSATPTGFSIASNVATFTATNSFVVGQKVTLSGFSTGTYFNGQQITVLSSGLSGSQFSGNFTHANVSTTTDSGTASLFPYALTLANPITPSLTSESNVAPYGMVEIGSEKFSYFGNSNYPASTTTPASITLTAGAQMGTSGASHSSGSTVIPVNPFINNPWPVTPTINGTGNQTPAGAEYFPAWSMGVAGLSFGVQDGSVSPFNPELADAHVHDINITLGVSAVSTAETPNNFEDQNSTVGMYFVNYPFNSHFYRITIIAPQFGIETGAPSYNTHGFMTGWYPTGDSDSWKDITIHSAAYPFNITYGGSNIYDNWQTFSQQGGETGTSWPGLTPAYYGGAAAWAWTGNYDDTTGAEQAPSHSVVSNMYIESENGSQLGMQGQGEFDGFAFTFNGNMDESIGGAFIGGAFQKFVGGMLDNGGNSSAPDINYGYANDFTSMVGVGGPIVSNLWGVGPFINYGQATACDGVSANNFANPGGGYLPICLGGQDVVRGQTNETFTTGNLIHPYVSSQGGMIYPFELANNGGSGNPVWYTDPTSPISYSMVACPGPVSGSNTCINQRINEFSFLTIGPGQRLTNGKYELHSSWRESSGSPQTTGFQLQAQGCSAAGTIYNNGAVPITTTWTDLDFGVIDLTSYAGCTLALINQGVSTSATTVENGYFDFAPVAAKITADHFATPGEADGCAAWASGVLGSTGSGCSGSVIASYGAPGLAPQGTARVTSNNVSGGVDAFAAINAAGLTLPSNGGTIDATGLGASTYTVTTQLTALNTATQAVRLILDPQTVFIINTAFGGTLTSSPANCALPVGPGSDNAHGSSSIVIQGSSYLGGYNFQLGSSARVWDVVCNGSFDGTQESLYLDGVRILGNQSAIMSGALLHLQGIFSPTLVANSGTAACYGQCLEVDSGNGVASTSGGNIMFFNDTFRDRDTYNPSLTPYPGSVVKFDTLTSAGGLGPIIFDGGLIEHNGPFNPLIVFNGRGGTQLGNVTFHNNYWEILQATTSSFWTNVDPIQFTDVSQIFVDTSRIGGSHVSAQAHLIDIATTNGTLSTYGINFAQLSAGVGFTSLIHNTVDGTDEFGVNNDGNVVIPPYTFGGAFPSLRFSTVAPSSGACTTLTIGSIWSNNSATTNPFLGCQIVSGIATWAAIGGGGGGSSPITTLGDIIAGGPFGVPQRAAGNTLVQPGFLSETGNGAGVSALPTWVTSSGSGAVCLIMNCQMVTPWIDNAVGTSVEIVGPYTGIHGAGAAIITPGVAAQVGVGGLYSDPVPMPGVSADSLGGAVTFTTGEGTLSAGVVFTVQVPNLRHNVPSCNATIKTVGGPAVAVQPYAEATKDGSDNVTLTMTTDVALATDTTYHFTWGPCDGN